MLSKKEFNRYTKQMTLSEIGIAGQVKLKEAKVLIIGAGGLGCPIAQYLNAMGVGTIGWVDFDVVDESNLHRQILYTPNDIGRLKIDCGVESLQKANGFTEWRKFAVAINDENSEEIIRDFDVVIDGCDNFMTRYIVNDTCVKLGKPLVYGSILSFDAQLAVFNHKGSKNLRDLFPEPPNAEDVPNCADNGVLGSFPGVIGTMMAQEAVKLILQLPVLRNELVLIETLDWSLKKFKF